MKRQRDIFANGPRGGFTLVELIIALAIVALIAGTLASNLRIAYRAVRESRAVVVIPAEGATAMEMACNDVANAFAPGSYLAGNFEGTQLANNSGEGDDLIFYSSADGPQHVDANGEIKEIELTTEQSGADNVLVRRVTRNLLPAAGVQVAPDEEVLCRGVKSFTLTYFDGTTWHPTWDSTQEDNDLPAAVQIVLEIQPLAGSKSNNTTIYTRIVPLSCSMAALDPNVNSGGLQ